MGPGLGEHKGGGLRPVLDLRFLNFFLRKDTFEMLPLAQVLSALDPGDRMVALDLQGRLSSRHTGLWFKVGNKHFQFAVLRFSLTSAP